MPVCELAARRTAISFPYAERHGKRPITRMTVSYFVIALKPSRWMDMRRIYSSVEVVPGSGEITEIDRKQGSVWVGIKNPRTPQRLITTRMVNRAGPHHIVRVRSFCFIFTTFWKSPSMI